MLRILRRMFGWFGRLALALGVGGLNLVGATMRTSWNAMRGQSSDQDAADALDARAAQDRQDALTREEREHRATLEALATETLEATLAAQVAPVPVVDDGAMRAQRRRRHEALRAAHDDAAEVRSSRFLTTPEPSQRAASTLQVA